MPWNEVSVVDQRREFVRLASVEGANRRELCRRFGISAETGYKWLQRSDAGDVGLADRSRRPLTSPQRSAANIETAVLAIRDAHPAWGARKIAACMARGKIEVPACSTVHAILARHGRIALLPGGPRATLRFEKEVPNLLWQMGITDPVMINAIALSKWRDQTNIQAFMDIFTQKNITNPIIITALANQVNLNAAWFADIANAITIAGITDQAVANDISRFSIKDPVLAAAFAIPKDPAVLNLIKTSANWLDSGYVNAFASAMYVAGITTAPSGALAAVIRSGNLDPVKIPLVLNSIAGTGTTNQTYMNSIAMNWITDTSVAIQAVNTFNAIGATDGRLSDTILAGRIFDVATAQNFYNVIGAAGSAVHSYSYLNTGLTSLTTFNNFVTATASAGIGHDYGKISTIANLVKTNNLTTVPEMQALINSTYPSGTVATAPTEGSTTITDSTTTSTTTTTTTIGTSTTSSTVIALETISGTCTVDCTASSF